LGLIDRTRDAREPTVLLHISEVNGLIFAVGCAIGYIVYRRTRVSPSWPSPTGDLAVSVAAVAAVIVTLAFLLGVDGNQPPQPEKTPCGVTTVTPSHTAEEGR
jgi:hypothetical protein